MAETSAVQASPRRGGIGRTGRRVAHSGRAGAARSAIRERPRSGPAPAVSESLRAGNRERSGLVSEFRCECGRSDCSEMVPVAAELHRGIAERLVVAPAHFEGGVVVRAADRFFVVEHDGYT